MAVAHYLEALDWQRDVIRLHTIFGGKNPHPNFLVGGMASTINLEDTATINAERLTDITAIIAKAQRFVEQVYWPDLLAVAGFYKDWAAIGGGTGNYMAVGEFPDNDVRDTDSLYLPRGIILNRDLSKVHPYDQQLVKEYINSSWYEYTKGDAEGLHPWEGETKAKYDGPPTPWTPGGGMMQSLFTLSLGTGWQTGSMSVFLENVFIGGPVSGRITSMQVVPSTRVPEPGTALTLGLGACALAVWRRRSRSKAVVS